MTDDCGCGCGGPAISAADNRPGLPAIDYRLGTFADFRAALLERLAAAAPFDRLTGRDATDYTVTLVELWAAVADVFTFYQERTANEAFLRTALSRDSVLRLARLLGYELAPGRAATGDLAFTLDPGVAAIIPAGTRVQSRPGPGEKPQKYETLAALAADARLNRLRIFPAPVPDQPFELGRTEAVLPAAVPAPVTGDRVMLFDGTTAEILTVDTVRGTTVRWTTPVTTVTLPTRVQRLGRAFRLFGHDAPATAVVDVPEDTTRKVRLEAWQVRFDRGTGSVLDLDGPHTGLMPEGYVLVTIGGTAAHVAKVGTVAAHTAGLSADNGETDTAKFKTKVVRSGLVTRLTLASPLPAFDLRTVVVHELLGEPMSFRTHRYPDRVTPPIVHLPGRRTGWSTMDIGGEAVEVDAFAPGRRVLLADDGTGSVPATVVAAGIDGTRVSVEPIYLSPSTAGLIGFGPRATAVTALVAGPVTGGQVGRLTVTVGSLPGQVIEIQAGDLTPETLAAELQRAIRAAAPGLPAFARTTVTAAGVLMVLPGVPGDHITFGPAEGDPATVTALGLEPGLVRYVDGVLSAPFAGAPVLAEFVHIRGSEGEVIRWMDTLVATADDVAAALNGDVASRFWQAVARPDGRVAVLPVPPDRPARPDHLRVQLAAEPFTLDTASAVLLGNVVVAAHGETIRDEVLGDGDAGASFPAYGLRKKPVVDVRLMVDGIEWEERETLYGAGPQDRVFVRRTGDDGSVAVRLGDGRHGARATTGRQNVTTTYRQGGGLAGRVHAGQLSTLLDRATGVRSVTNPVATDGGADPETLATARTAAPGTVRTFGRAVALRDFEDAALVGGELAKARADWVWAGDRRVVHLTVAAQGGFPLSAAGVGRIRAALDERRDPHQRLIVADHVPVPIVVDATLTVDPLRAAAAVLADARLALLDSFAFARRDLAAPVHLSDVVRILQDTGGVVAVDLNVLDRGDTDPAQRGPKPRLPMRPARPGAVPGEVLPAELAVLDDVALRTTGGRPG